MGRDLRGLVGRVKRFVEKVEVEVKIKAEITRERRRQRDGLANYFKPVPWLIGKSYEEYGHEKFVIFFEGQFMIGWRLTELEYCFVDYGSESGSLNDLKSCDC